MNQLKTIIRGLINLLYILYSSLFVCIYFMFPCLVLIRPLSKNLYYKLNSYVTGSWFRYFLILPQVVNQTEIRIHGKDQLKPDESVILMMNHPSEVDWSYAWAIANQVGATNCIKVLLKDEIKYVPGVGWGCDNLDFIYLTRNWEFDEQHMAYKMSLYTQTHTKPWIVIFPEGTDFDQEKQKKSWDYCDKNGFPKFDHVLLPRHRGLNALIKPLREHKNIDAVIDCTIAYQTKPTILSYLLGTNPKIVNINLERIPISKVPSDETSLQNWIIDIYARKDKLVDNFKKNNFKFSGNFINPKIELQTWLSFSFWIVFTILMSYITWTSTFFFYYFIITYIFFILNSHFKSIREFRGLQTFHKKPLKKTN